MRAVPAPVEGRACSTLQVGCQRAAHQRVFDEADSRVPGDALGHPTVPAVAVGTALAFSTRSIPAGLVKFRRFRMIANIQVRRVMIEETARQLSAALRDGSLGTQGPPEYSEQAVAKMVEERHAANVRSRRARSRYRGDGDPARGIRAVFDSCWVQGLLDVERSGFEEYGWLARIYASEHDDGNLAWNITSRFSVEVWGARAGRHAVEA